MTEIKIFDKWNEVKKSIEQSNHNWIIKPREIYCELNPFHKNTKSYAVLSQVRFYSSKRIKSKFSKISQDEFEIVKEKLGEILYAPKKGLPEQAGNLEDNYNSNKQKSKEMKND